MNLNLKRKFQYAFKLLLVHKKRYFTISRIIIIVLMLLSLFLIGTDTMSFNKYKSYLQLPKEMIVTSFSSDSELSSSKIKITEKLEQESYHSYKYSKILSVASYYQNSKKEHPTLEVNFIDSNYFKYPRISQGTMIDNRQLLFPNESKYNISSFNKEIIINYSTSMALFGSLDSIGKKVLLDSNIENNQDMNYMTYRVVGIIEDNKNFKDNETYEVYMSKEDTIFFNMQDSTTYSVFFNKDYSKHLSFAQSQNIGDLVFSHQLIQRFYTQRYQDTILVFSVMLVIALLAELTIYSSFLNVFEFRLPEFGILLALGAKKRDIFLIQMIEVWIIMLVSTIISIFLSLFFIKGIIYYYAWSKGQYYTLYLSMDNLLLLIIFLLVLSTVTSLVISIKSTNYKIIDTIRSN